MKLSRLNATLKKGGACPASIRKYTRISAKAAYERVQHPNNVNELKMFVRILDSGRTRAERFRTIRWGEWPNPGTVVRRRALARVRRWAKERGYKL